MATASLVGALLDQAREASQALSRLADRDIVAYRERSATKCITVPIDVARAAAEGLALCDQAKPLVHALLAPDLALLKSCWRQPFAPRCSP